jgi:predicted nuclease of predicted toxin-antitoxin system
LAAHLGFLIDENLTPGLALTAQARGFQAFHAPWVGLGNTADSKIARYAIDKNLVMVTNNLVHFRRIYRTKELHPGLILLKVMDSDIMDREAQHHMFGAAIENIDACGEPVNQTVTVELSENAAGDWLLQVRRAVLAKS